ncbi:hypothetical protein AMTRI_Chr07g79370 [Amborella trichopoda]
MDRAPSQVGRPELEALADSKNNGFRDVRHEFSSSSLSKIQNLRNSRSNSLSKSSSELESPSYGGGQSLASILNNPHLGKGGVYGSDASWVGWWPAPGANSIESTPLITPRTFPEINQADFQPYLNSISESYGRFEDIRHHKDREKSVLEPKSRGAVGELRGQGEALVACLREVPSLYFKEDFALEDGVTFKAACPFSSINENLVLQEKLSHYLDVVEVHLVKEISLRSDSFFEAQGHLQDLNKKIVEACGRLRELKETIRILDIDVVENAQQIQELNRTRGNLLALQQKLRLILYVNQALSTLKLLVAASDCAGALDVIDDLQHLLDGDELTGLHCFRHLRDQLTMSSDAINSILAAEFLRAAIYDARELDRSILSKLPVKTADLSNGKEEEVKLDEDESSSLRDRLLPLIIGLLRTAKLPSVLRVYRDTLISDMKTAIKTTVAELLPLLYGRPVESDLSTGERPADSDGGGLSLASKLRNLSSESFVQLLAAIFKIVQAHLVRAAEVKKVIEWVMGGLDGSPAMDSVAAVVALGAAAAAAAEAAQENVTQLSSPSLLQKNATKVQLLLGKANDISSPANISKNFIADVLRENAEAVFAACDAAHGRWAKLLGVRALLHPKLRLQDFLSVYNITQDFISATEKIGGRLGYSIRGTLQSQSKAFVDFQHISRITKITAVLDQETWVAIDIPDEFQAIVDLFICSEAVIAEGEEGSLQLNPAQQTNTIDGSRDDSAKAAYSQSLSRQNSVESSVEHVRHANTSSQSGGSQENTVESSPRPITENDHHSSKGHDKSPSQKLFHKGVGYHMVNCGLILLKMLSEYTDISNNLPASSSEVVQRVVEILKLFNSRTCQLVLGARAIQVTGLKSITAKHLALASQVVSFFYAIIPEIRRILFLKVPEPRKALLVSEIDRVAQDYRVHKDAIHTKLVNIMKDRLPVHLPEMAKSWNQESDAQPSLHARQLTKEVGVLQRVLSRTLPEADVHIIFRQVVQVFHSEITATFSKMDVNSPEAKARMYRDIHHILGCIHSLPTDDSSKDGVNSGQLDEFLAQRFGTDAVH